jgi:hypothetical protein
VTTHSKGANLAQYIIIACENSISRCVSFDGQGFSWKFHRKYKDEIDAAKGRICSISSNKDPVNGLLKPVAGEFKFIKSGSKNYGVAHKSTELLKENLFKDGNFIADVLTKKAREVKLFNGIANATHYIPIINKVLGNVGGVAAGLIAGKNKMEFLKATIKSAFKGIPKSIISNFKILSPQRIKGIFNKNSRINQKLITEIKNKHKGIMEKIKQINPSVNFTYEYKKGYEKLLNNMKNDLKLTDSRYYSGINNDLEKLNEKMNDYGTKFSIAYDMSKENNSKKQSIEDIKRNIELKLDKDKSLNKNNISKDTQKNISKFNENTERGV